MAWAGRRFRAFCSSDIRCLITLEACVSEFGIVMAQGRHPGQKAPPRVLEDAENDPT